MGWPLYVNSEIVKSSISGVLPSLLGLLTRVLFLRFQVFDTLCPISHQRRRFTREVH